MKTITTIMTAETPEVMNPLNKSALKSRTIIPVSVNTKTTITETGIIATVKKNTAGVAARKSIIHAGVWNIQNANVIIIADITVKSVTAADDSRTHPYSDGFFFLWNVSHIKQRD
ncbi:hypothetical protein V6B33_18655 [Mangrovibacillus sp. Mu-81]|jgi:hypothetical protein|uniref:hypothetical protein n=1 Tax=Mangrovibacillus sp. Mu-81 TaxID=3121478 RepID=UPI002FE49FB6